MLIKLFMHIIKCNPTDCCWKTRAMKPFFFVDDITNKATAVHKKTVFKKEEIVPD